ncbi:MAG: glycosyltransferase family 2 protein [Gemmatimonadales bacterium]
MAAASSPSVVVASRQAPAELGACLAALVPQCERSGSELIVARDGAAAPIDQLLERYPGVTLVIGPSDASIPVLRGLGLAASTGDPVALTEDHLIPAADWLERLFAAFGPGVACVGGGMANTATGRATDWAAYFADYGFYSRARPAAPGPPLITDANVAYRREVVARVAEWARAGAWENVVHDRLLAQGHGIRWEPGARVDHHHRYGYLAFLRNRFEHGRDYAMSRRAEAPGTSRVVRALTAPALVALLFGRIARASWREAPLAWWVAAPITLSFVAGWAVGEAAGYLRPGGGAPNPTG